jgi:hypothetical protein
MNPKRTRPASIAAVACACTPLQIHDQAHFWSNAMNIKFVVVGAIAAALVAGTAMAQTPTAATRPEINSTSVNQVYKGQWRLYKMIGLDVYNQNDEKVGDISELLVDQTGKIQTAILGVGGFLGVGDWCRSTSIS